MELNVPLMLYWDLAENLSPPVVDAVCGDVASLGILTVHVRAGRSALPAVMRIGANLRGRQSAVFVTVPAADAGAFLKLVGEGGVRGCFAEVSGADDMAAVPPGVAGVSLTVSTANFHQIPAVGAMCGKMRISKLVLPMERLQRGEQTLAPNETHREELTGLLSTMRLPASVKVTAHDPFLWEVLFPELPYPDNGCQAANTMMYISPDLDIYPCPAFPHLLGNLHWMSLRDVVFSSEKASVRSTLAFPPDLCRSCGDVVTCRGGCRGRSYALHGTTAAADPACC